MKEPKAPPRALMTLLFAAVVFCILVITMLIVGGVIYLVARTGAFDGIRSPNLLLPILFFALVSVVTGTIVATIMSGIPLKPVSRLISGLNRLASGDYSARLEIGRHPMSRELEQSFNLLASELQNTEMLRSDFVNNFSHEFKTPIVSIRGFARLLLRDGLTDEQRREYLGIIADESGRLADMATNVLNLTKVENQSILTDAARLNISEQLRNCVLLLEKKWSRKGLDISADFEEIYVDANEELLKQVWINIIDNAIKFSPEGGEIGIFIAQERGAVVVSIENAGPQISEADQKRIFNKYWQGDTSHSSEGTGIGLSIARRVAELHGGAICVDSTPGRTIFTVRLPA